MNDQTIYMNPPSHYVCALLFTVLIQMTKIFLKVKAYNNIKIGYSVEPRMIRAGH